MTSYTVEHHEVSETIAAIRSFGISGPITEREERGVVVLEWDPATRLVRSSEPKERSPWKTYAPRCKCCGKTFNARRSNAKTCGDQCRMKLAAERRAERDRARRAAA